MKNLSDEGYKKRERRYKLVTYRKSVGKNALEWMESLRRC